MAVDYKLMGGRIQQARKRLYMTQERLAEKIGVSVGYISQIERGYTKVSLDTLSVIAGHVNCDIAQLVTGVVPEQEAYMQDELLRRYVRLDHRQKRIVLECIDVILKNEKRDDTK